jgi:hypothetical protein
MKDECEMGRCAAQRRGLLFLAAMIVLSGRALAGGFLRGNADGKLGLNVGDAIGILRYVSEGGQLGCKDAADVNDDGSIGIDDAIHLLLYLFRAGPPPAAPFPELCGADSTEDALDCQVITEGDGIFFVIDKSNGFAGTGGFAIAKREVLRNVNEFSSCIDLGIVFFDSSVVRFPADGKPAAATAEAKQSAIDFVNAVWTGSGSCIRAGLLAGLDFADQSTAARKVIVYVGDGGGMCQGADEATYLNQTLDAVRERNQGEVQFNTICVLSCSTLGTDFLKRLAAENGGTYTRIVR